jgi:lysophospholipase L1-like esterase
VRASGLRLITVALVLVLSSACGHHQGPTQPPPTAPGLQCPVDVSTESLDANPTIVTYSSPTASAGTPPYTITCTPPSGAAFTIGTTPVQCSVVDAAAQTANCSFTVRVQSAPKLSVTTFLAFGDSLTYGTTSASPTLLLNDIADSYPTKLQRLLRSRYQTQNPVVLNDGIGGERVVGQSNFSLGGIVRLPQSVAEHPSDVLLLMEGSNDLLNSYEDGVAPAIEGLRRMIEYARSHGVRHVLLATIPPMRAGGARHRDAAAALVPGYNDQVRGIAGSEGVPLVDVYSVLVDKMYLIGVDDLHPTPQGYDLIAATFLESIKGNFQEPRSLRAR